MEHRLPTQGDETTFLAILRDWSSLHLDKSPVPEWELAMSSMQAEVRALRQDGRWRSGGRTLLHALGLHHDEVLLCRALAWLLTPDGWHGLGDRFIVRILHDLGLDADEASSATVAREEMRGDTRADIVVRAGSTMVLIEAKVFAPEQPRQADRLAELWSDEAPRLVFLTRDGRQPQTAMESRGDWLCLSWTELAELLAQVVDDLAQGVDDGPHCAAGVHDILETLQRYGR